jgi:hypothetical protein
MGRRKSKKGKEAGGRPPKRSQPPPILGTQSLWRRIAKWVYALIALVALLVTLLEGVPWLSIEESGSLDPRNPYATLFSVTNAGYVPATDLDALCDAKFEDAWHNTFNSVQMPFEHFAEHLPHSGRVTIPCFREIELRNWPLIRAELTVTVTYSLYPMTWHLLRRHQTFRFRAVKDSTGLLHWTFLS